MPKTTVGIECAICINTEPHPHWIVLIACGHLFHEPCIRQWTNPPEELEVPEGEPALKKKNYCPTCRTKIIRPRGNKSLAKDNSRFAKIVFQGDIVDSLSSSPVRCLQQDTITKRRNASLIRGSSEDELEELADGDSADDEVHMQQGAPAAGHEDILTESESDEDNARPARPVYRRVNEQTNVNPAAGPSTTNNANDNRDRSTLGEARATIAFKDNEIRVLQRQLQEQRVETTKAVEDKDKIIMERQIIEGRMIEMRAQIKELQDKLTKQKNDYKEVRNTCNKEVDKVANLSATNNRSITIISNLTTEKSELEREYNELRKAHDVAMEEHDARMKDLRNQIREITDASNRNKELLTRANQGNHDFRIKLDRKKIIIDELNAEIERLRRGGTGAGADVPASTSSRKREKGKARALDQNDSGLDQNYGEDDLDASFAAPRTRQTSNRSIKSNYLFSDADDLDNDNVNADYDESLQITEIPDSEENNIIDLDDYGDESYGDLDAAMFGAKPSKSTTKTKKQAVVARHALLDLTNSPTSKSTSGNATGKSTGTAAKAGTPAAKTTKKRSLTTLGDSSAKWADMALFGEGRTRQSIALGERKKAKTKF